MKTNKTEIKKIILELLSQSDLLAPSMKQKIESLNQTQLENLLIITDKAVSAESKMTQAQKKDFVELLKSFFNAKKRIYRKTEQAFKVRQEAKFERQEAVIEDLLIQQIKN